ncbi:sugar-transfer associated ATP-grasp domain-containing protein [Halorubrum sp. Ib24]|uniref:sugar-transfer associated ATP-grasp domain-containing protein n=1 Tax=Halorubrum sp. Ib24 TaxID=1383850 RepID=UPI00130311BB|nr:sugar-transfer associated ATP-grasp domain-containing protein [Halorubrum sp. Ib24]
MLQYLLREIKLWNEYPIPAWKRLYAWRHGFNSRIFVLLDLDNSDPSNYLSATQQLKYIWPAVNPAYADVLENKAAYHLSTEGHVDHISEFYGLIRDGQFHAYSKTGGSLLDALHDEGDLILKPVTGTHGRGVFHLSTNQDGYRINDEPSSEAEVIELIDGTESSVVTEYVENHAYAESISPTSVNTIRILTMRNPDTGEFFAASAVHRFGNDSTGPVDNWSGGGFAAPVDVETGEFGDLHTYSSDGGLQRLKCHPETGTRVSGERIPGWESAKEAAIEMAEHHRENPYVGWDIVLTDDGPVVIEGNCAPGLSLQQLGCGLLEDERVVAFLNTLAPHDVS